jgi:hypothetical protein
MTRMVILLLVAAMGWFGYTKYQHRAAMPITTNASTPRPTGQPPAPSVAPAASPFKCDGRIYCSQMSSCAEATFFLKNCPGTKMDGNNDGIPCEKQWCK